MSISFRDYPDIKSALDERSLNPQVRTAFQHALRGREWLSCLDLGAGAGASLWRLLNADLKADLAITAVDPDRDLLELALRRLAVLLRARDFEVATPGPDHIQARRGGRSISIEFVAAGPEDFNRQEPTRQFDVVVAHHVTDLLPTQAMADRIASWLKPQGVFYAALNYDTGTTVFPAYRDADLEQRILATYDSAMETRRMRDQPAEAAKPGGWLHGSLLESQLDILAQGASDWNLTPLRRAYRDQDDLCLDAVLAHIRDEADRSGGIGPRALDAWHRDRRQEIDRRRLGLIVHQVDVLARRGA